MIDIIQIESVLSKEEYRKIEPYVKDLNGNQLNILYLLISAGFYESASKTVKLVLKIWEIEMRSIYTKEEIVQFMTYIRSMR